MLPRPLRHPTARTTPRTRHDQVVPLSRRRCLQLPERHAQLLPPLRHHLLRALPDGALQVCGAHHKRPAVDGSARVQDAAAWRRWQCFNSCIMHMLKGRWLSNNNQGHTRCTVNEGGLCGGRAWSFSCGSPIWVNEALRSGSSEGRGPQSLVPCSVWEGCLPGPVPAHAHPCSPWGSLC